MDLDDIKKSIRESSTDDLYEMLRIIRHNRADRDEPVVKQLKKKKEKGLDALLKGLSPEKLSELLKGLG